MSISPPSDIVLDVARAADPARYAEAAARLTRPAAGSAAAEPFAVVLAPPPPANAAPPPPAPRSADPAADAYRGFEAMVLATLIEATIPDELSAVYGSGTAGDLWKSMLAEQFGAAMAEAGGIGIARQLAEQAAARSATETLLVTAIERHAIGAAKPDAAASDPLDPTGWTE